MGQPRTDAARARDRDPQADIPSIEDLDFSAHEPAPGEASHSALNAAGGSSAEPSRGLGSEQWQREVESATQAREAGAAHRGRQPWLSSRAKSLDSLIALYVNDLMDLHDAELQLLEALPKVAREVKSPELKEALLSHFSETLAQARRVEAILTELNEQTAGQRCEAMSGLIAECTELLGAECEPSIRDAGLVVAAQKIEHYEIAAYGSLCAFARILDRGHDAERLHASLEEEKGADKRLTELAAHGINNEAAAVVATPRIAPADRASP